MMTIPGTAKHLRRGLVLGLYRWTIGCIFLLVAFNALPSYKWLFGWGLILFNLSIESIVTYVETMVKLQNAVDDAAERKTRHTILLAQQLTARSEVANETTFWNTVDARVGAESPEADKKTAWWAHLGLAAGGLVGRFSLDVFGILLALILTGG